MAPKKAQKETIIPVTDVVLDNKKLKKVKAKPVNKTDVVFDEEGFSPHGIIYVGHTPHGFYEKQMSAYFSQFGEVKNVVLSRCRRTGKSRGYAFIQFDNINVARIAAEAMNGYPIKEKVLKSHLVAPEKVNRGIFRNANQKWRKIPWRTVIRDLQDRPKTEDQAVRNLQRTLKRESAQQAKLKELGIDYEFENTYAKQAEKQQIFAPEEIMEAMGSDEDDEDEEEEEHETSTKAARGKRAREEEEVETKIVKQSKNVEKVTPPKESKSVPVNNKKKK